MLLIRIIIYKGYDKSVHRFVGVFINDDINATAKGYEYLAELNMRKGGGKK